MPVRFKLDYTIREFFVGENVAYQFVYGGPRQLTVVLRRPSADDQASGHSPSSAFCVASCVTEPNKSTLDVFCQIESNNITDTETPQWKTMMEYSGSEGSGIRMPALACFRDPFRQFVNDIQNELSDFAKRTVAVMRWRINELASPHNPISTRGLSWSFDGEFWHPAPRDVGARLEIHSPVRLSSEVRTSIEEIVASGRAEPVSHELLREAWKQRGENPRSAVLIGLAAAELAMKRCISEVVPSAEWLAMNLPTPPLEKMLREYLPKLPVCYKIGGEVKPPPEEVLKTLKKGVAVRNGIAHAGGKSPSFETVEEILWAVRDLLYLLDYYSGSEWAWDHLRDSSRSALTSSS